MAETKMLGFELRRIHNLTKTIIRKSHPVTGKPPLTQLQAGIMGYLYRHQEQPVYQKNIEEEFKISRATATNTLQVMEKNGLITRNCVDRDGRLKRITMTEPAGRDHMQVQEHMKMMEDRMLRGMSDTEQAELFRLLAKVHGNLEGLSSELDKSKENLRSKEEETC